MSMNYETQPPRPCFGFIKGHKPRRDPMALNKIEIHRLLDAARYCQRDRIILQLMYYCALRVSNVVNMTKDWIDMDKWVITIPVLRNKTRKRLGVVVPREFRADLESYLMRCDVPNKLFTKNRCQIWAMCQKYAKLAGIKKGCYPHALRASAAVKIIRERGAAVAARHLGHSHPGMTLKHYSPLDDDEMIDQIENIDM